MRPFDIAGLCSALILTFKMFRLEDLHRQTSLILIAFWPSLDRKPRKKDICGWYLVHCRISLHALPGVGAAEGRVHSNLYYSTQQDLVVIPIWLKSTYTHIIVILFNFAMAIITLFEQN